ncbi:unnamed protein product [Prunus armeniaca]|uniref:Uncharacterized protein n=1 Tax=Prunus armeniaca TaxID=36596 RepID=A0A6J5TMV8_PRUAR|nr:unnamed protein product [Prunus armeniaca]
MSFLFKALTYEIDYVVGVEFGEENGKVGKERERKGDRDNEVFGNKEERGCRQYGVGDQVGWVGGLVEVAWVDEVVVAVGFCFLFSS